MRSKKTKRWFAIIAPRKNQQETKTRQIRTATTTAAKKLKNGITAFAELVAGSIKHCGTLH